MRLWTLMHAVLDTRASAKCICEIIKAAKQAGWSAASSGAEQPKRFRQDMSDHAAFWIVPVAVETRRYALDEAARVIETAGS